LRQAPITQGGFKCRNFGIEFHRCGCAGRLHQQPARASYGSNRLAIPFVAGFLGAASFYFDVCAAYFVPNGLGTILPVFPTTTSSTTRSCLPTTGSSRVSLISVTVSASLSRSLTTGQPAVAPPRLSHHAIEQIVPPVFQQRVRKYAPERLQPCVCRQLIVLP
jgi:hypothetical protein